MKIKVVLLIYILTFNSMIKCQEDNTLPIKVALISSGLPNDLGYNFQANQALVGIQKSLKSVNMNFFGNISELQCTDFITDLIENKGYNVLISISPSHENCVRILSNHYLELWFMYRVRGVTITTPSIPFLNQKQMFTVISHDYINYITGFYAGSITKTNKLGYIATSSPESTIVPVSSFFIGAVLANPNVTLDFYTVPSTVDTEVSTAATLQLIEMGIDVIGQNLDDMSVSLAALANGKFGMGTNGFDQSKIFGKLIPFTFTSNWTTCLMFIIDAALQNTTTDSKRYMGTFSNGFATFNIINNYDLSHENELMLRNLITDQFRPVTCNELNHFLYKNDYNYSCIGQRQLYNITDPFPGMDFHGNYTMKISLRKLSSSITRVFSIISIVFIGLSFLLSVIVFLSRNKPSFRYSSPVFCIFIIIGAIIVYCGVVVWVRPVSKIACTLRLWLVSEGFTILIGSLVVKNFRIWLIFDNKEFKTIRITNLQLFPWIFILIVMNTFIMVIISYRGEIDTTNIFGVDDLTKYEYLQTCSMNQIGWIALYSLLCYFFILVTVGLLVSWKTRIVDIDELSDSKTIANTLYTLAFGLAIIISLIVSPQTYQNQTIILAISGLFMTTISILILFSPKIFKINSKNLSQYKQSIISTLRYLTPNHV